MDCPTCEAMVDAYVDGELSATENAAFEQALAECPGCRARLEAARDMSRLLRGMPAEPAPDLLRARIERELRSIAGRPRERERERVRWLAMAASLIVALGVGWIGGSMLGQGARETDALVAGYLRVAMSDSGVEVASSDRHTVKPWFAGRIDYSPPVHDLTAQGFPLLGGRVDLIDGRKAAVLVYRRNQHRIALTLWPASGGDTTPSVDQRDGFALADWRRGGFAMRAVADLSPAEMKSFAAAVDRAVAADR
ncbi:Transmembrane transcriptional regulator (anti-sigma factor RsiW) [Rhodospirillales bacterium URHD0017]|nr:Transmembrane transcriptional regulator (anti-sigma factor RsiW) [Rhodospirillales bacterium URHD0017]